MLNVKLTITKVKYSACLMDYYGFLQIFTDFYRLFGPWVPKNP